MCFTFSLPSTILAFVSISQRRDVARQFNDYTMRRNPIIKNTVVAADTFLLDTAVAETVAAVAEADNNQSVAAESERIQSTEASFPDTSLLIATSDPLLRSTSVPR